MKNDCYLAGDQKKEKIDNMATTLEIIKGISQAVANTYDGSHKESYNADGKSREVGLKREEGNPINDSRVVDGFKVKFNGPYLEILYHSEIQLKEVHDGGFEEEMERMITEIAKFLKKEYKDVTGDTLTLTEDGEVNVVVQNVSRRWSFVQANKRFKIGGIDDVVPVAEASEERLRDTFKKFFELGKNPPTPKNVTRKEA